MSNERQFLSEITRNGEQLCVIRDLYDEIPPECHQCGLLRFCEEQRSDGDIESLMIKIGQDKYRHEFFKVAEEDGYYD